MSFNQHYSEHYDAQFNTFQSNFNPQYRLYPNNPTPANSITNPTKNISDEEFVSKWNEILKNRVIPETKKRSPSIIEARNNLRGLVRLLDEIKDHEKYLTDHLNDLADSEWVETFVKIDTKKSQVNDIMGCLNDSYLDALRASLTKRNSKRLRLKRLKLERASERQLAMKERDDKTRRIDEDLQKMKDELERKKRKEEDKIKADVVLRDVFRKKHDAKKCIAKLDALIKLRKARENTARGRGDNISESETKLFNENIQKLISMWTHKLSCYEKEESELRAKLALSPDVAKPEDAREKEIIDNLSKWREVMFGSEDATPQRDFGGNVDEFIAVRRKWDEFISKEGTAIPVGWLLPQPVDMLSWTYIPEPM